MMRGLRPVSTSKEDRALRGGPVVRFITSTACEAANVQKDVGAEAAVRFLRARRLHDGPDGSLGHTIQLMHVRWA
eukprot:6175844-Pleurochrysis_carterae.AAC.1